MRELFERIRPSLRDYLYLCCSFKRYSSLTGLVHIAPHGKRQGSICHEEKVAYRHLFERHRTRGLYATKKRWRIDPFAYISFVDI